MADDGSQDGGPGGYSDDPKPLGSYALITAGFGAGFGAALVEAVRRDRLPERIVPVDIVIAGIATHKLSRLIAKDPVTSFLRAPFVRYEGAAQINEVSETPRGEGLRGAIGELVFCPQCVGLWVAAGIVAGLVAAPRATRTGTAALAALTLADFLHLGYQAAGRSS